MLNKGLLGLNLMSEVLHIRMKMTMMMMMMMNLKMLGKNLMRIEVMMLLVVLALLVK
jgi:hypothetical protein